MGFIDKIKGFIYNNDSEYDEEMGDGYEEETSSSSSSASTGTSDFYASSRSSSSCFSGSR